MLVYPRIYQNNTNKKTITQQIYTLKLHITGISGIIILITLELLNKHRYRGIGYTPCLSYDSRDILHWTEIIS